jgi:Tfp pilus assembly protein PilO
MMIKLDLKFASWRYFSWLFSRLVKQLGFFGLLGLAITLVCCLFYVTKIWPLTAQFNLAQQQLTDINSSAKIISNVQQTPASDIAQEISTFNKLLPQTNTLHQRLSLIDSAALKQHLILDRGDYKLTHSKQDQITTNLYLSHYEIVLPVAGQYRQIREFITNVLQQQPTLALSDIKIKRDNTTSPTVEARLVFVLFLRGDSL